MKTRRLALALVAASSLFITSSSTKTLLAAPHDERGGLHAEPLATLNADITQLTVYGPTARGVRVDVAFKGTLQGRLSGTMEGVDYSTIGADGVTYVDVHAKITTLDQALISVEIEGTLVNGQVTDTRVKFLTAAPQYAYLQDKIVVGQGLATQQKLEVKYYLVK